MKRYLNQYQTEGYCILKGVIPTAACRAVLKEMDAIFASQLKALRLRPLAFKGETTLYANMQRLFKADVNAYLAAARQLNKLLSVQDLLFHESVRPYFKRFGLPLLSVPTGPVVSIMGDKLRIPGGYHGLAPHQDWPSMQGSLDALVIWTPLMDVDEMNFPLQVIPQSHLRGLWEGINTASAREIDPKLYQDDDFVSVIVERGDVVLMSAFTVHRTGIAYGGNECSGLRIACNSRVENSAEKTFVKRQFPCAYRRSVERELITKNFPTRIQVKAAISPPEMQRQL